MRTIHIIAGITTLAHYRDKTDGRDLGAEHDQIFAFATDKPLSDADVEKMRKLGWFQPNVEGNDAVYDPTECWSCCV